MGVLLRANQCNPVMERGSPLGRTDFSVRQLVISDFIVFLADVISSIMYITQGIACEDVAIDSNARNLADNIPLGINQTSFVLIKEGVLVFLKDPSIVLAEVSGFIPFRIDYNF